MIVVVIVAAALFCCAIGLLVWSPFLISKEPRPGRSGSGKPANAPNAQSREGSRHPRGGRFDTST